MSAWALLRHLFPRHRAIAELPEKSPLRPNVERLLDLNQLPDLLCLMIEATVELGEGLTKGSLGGQDTTENICGSTCGSSGRPASPSEDVDAATKERRRAQQRAGLSEPDGRSVHSQVRQMGELLSEERAKLGAARAEIAALKHDIEQALGNLRSECEARIEAEAQRDGLYAALKYIYAHMQRTIDLHPVFGLDAIHALEMARAALAKARGEG